MVEKQFRFYSDRKRDFAPMGIENFDDGPRKFLTALFELSKGDVSRQVSMYKVGEAIGMDRDEASRAAEVLMGNGLVEIKTLSGGIGITETALDALKASAEDTTGTEKVSPLTQAWVLDAAGRHSIDMALTSIKHNLNELALNFDAVTGVVADIKTIEAQLTSPSPKTAIIRECFVSLKSFVEKSSLPLIKNHIRAILGD